MYTYIDSSYGLVDVYVHVHVHVQWSESRQLRSEALGSIPSGYPSFFRFYSDLPPVAYQQFLLPVVVIRIVTKNSHVYMYIIILYMYIIHVLVIFRGHNFRVILMVP